MIYPAFKEISYNDPLLIFNYFAADNGSVLFNSAMLMEDCGRYSFIAIDPFAIQFGKKNDVFLVLEAELKKYKLELHPHMPPFQGGSAGFFSYDVCHQMEKLPIPQDDMNFPDAAIGFYDLVIAYDHLLKRAWIFSSGFPILENTARQQRALQRCEWLNNIVRNHSHLPSFPKVVPVVESIETNFTQQQYQDAVLKVKEYILAGDIFEANISQRFTTTLPQGFSTFDLYRRLQAINPAPFNAYLNFEDTTLVSGSPERFVKLTNSDVETRPIKGTFPRGKTPQKDLEFANTLLASEKDRAENIMIVDLLRNDLSKVCKPHSVSVPQLCGLESYANVHHLVSVVKGKLKAELNAVDLLKATFPGGSITGAPKIRAMEIITEIEALQRGPYCGCIAYIGFNGDLDSSITIRTFAIKNNKVTFQAGGAIVIDSDPEKEYKETLLKAEKLIAALTKVMD